MSKMDTKYFCHSERLFFNEDGTPIVFHVLSSPDRDEIVQLIKAGGGVVIDGDNIRSAGAITISSSSEIMENTKQVISSSYIYVCCFYGERIDMEEFRIIPGNGGSGASEGINGSKYSASHSCTSLSNDEVHQLLVYILKCENLWKEIDEKKVCDSKSWKTIQKSFACWTLERFFLMSSLNMKTLWKIEPQYLLKSFASGTLPQDGKHQTKRGSTEINPTQSSRADIDTELINVVVSEKKEEMQHGVEKEISSRACGKKELTKYSLQSKDASLEGSENESDGEGSISLCSMRKRVAGCTSVVIDEECASEPEEQDLGSKCKAGRSVCLDMNIGNEKEVVSESKMKENSREQKLSCENEDLDKKDCHHVAVSPNKKVPSLLRRTKKLMRTNHSVPTNEWLRKGKSNMSVGNKGKMLTSTPNKEIVLTQNYSDMEDVSCSSSEPNSPDVASKQKTEYKLRLYTYKEDMQLLQWLCRKRKMSNPLTGNRIWKFMESRKVLPGRSWQSMRERFRRRIAPNLKDYRLPKEDLLKLNQ